MDCYVKKTRVSGDVLVAVCDKEVLGKEFKEGKLRLKVNPSFYRGQLLSIEDTIEEIKNSSIANIVGNKIVEKIKEEGLVHESSILRISGISHVQIIKV
ncbi:MAG: DUF424 domain-containing protein [Candidatus Odinarchaeia archaeon]